ncbi:MAG: hypothetical protein EOP11_24275, partial [Proteobacteria bacterium]
MGQFIRFPSLDFTLGLALSFYPLLGSGHGLHGHGNLERVLTELQDPSGSLNVEAACAETTNAGTPSSAGLCDDLYRFSCAPGEWADGTGSAGSDDIVTKKVAELKLKLGLRAAKDFSALLKTEKGGYLRQLALSAYGMNHTPGCAGDAKARAHCDRTLSEALGAQVTKNLFPRGQRAEGPPGPRPVSLRALDLMQQNA